MTRLHERIVTDLPIETTFDFIADFANAAVWDPGVAWGRRPSRSTSLSGVGTTYELGVRMGGRVAPMTYRISDSSGRTGSSSSGRDPASTPSTTSASSAAAAGRRSTTRRTSGCAGSAGCSSRSSAARSRGSAAMRRPAWPTRWRRCPRPTTTTGRRLMRIAIIGAGISGLSAAYALHREHDIALYDAESPVGGHVQTVTVDTADGPLPVDMGFIVHNDVTYPTFLRHDRRARRADPAERHVPRLGLPRLRRRVQLARRAGLVRPAERGGAPGPLAAPSGHPAVLPRRPRRLDADGAPSRSTLGDYLDEMRFGAGFRDHFLVPITSAVWSTASADILDYPLDYLLRFLDHHGLIGVGRSLQWRTITGGSMVYVERILDRIGRDVVRAGDPVVDVERDGTGVRVRTAAGTSDRFDARRARHPRRRCASDAAGRRRSRTPGARCVRVHDEPGRPAHRRAAAAPTSRCARVVERRPGRLPAPGRAPDDDLPHEPAAVADGAGRVLRVGQSGRAPGPGADRGGSLDAPSELHLRDARRAGAVEGIQGWRRTWYAGAHLGYGFHEDGCRSGFAAAERIAAAAIEERAA